jgi:hypothetical protein
MREEEPQSYRDLALALNETGAYNEAVQLMYKLVLGTWHGRFTDVKSITLNEMNAIISAHPGRVDLVWHRSAPGLCHAGGCTDCDQLECR